MHPTILILGYSEAAMFLRQPEAARIQAIISIHGKREYAVEASVPHRLTLHFDDVEAPDMRDPVQAYQRMMQQRRDAENGLDLKPPTIDDARDILHFAEKCRNLEGIMLCQCQGGVSRSTAAALPCLAAWSGSGQEESCVTELLRCRACAAPHRDLVQFADTLLHRDGRLVRAVAQMQSLDMGTTRKEDE